MITDLDMFQANPEDRASITSDLPKTEQEFSFAKSFLQKSSALSGDNLYDHLSEILNKVLSERPENVIDIFEEYSRKVKEMRFKPLTDHLQDVFVPPGRYSLATKIMPLLKTLPPEEPSTLDPEEKDLADMSKNNMLDLLYYFEHVGVGLPKTETFCLMLSMRQLIRQEPIASVRFWGKISGVQKNYLVLEAKLKEEEYVRRNDLVQDAAMEEAANATQLKDEMAQQLDNIARQQELPGEGEDSKPWGALPPLPQSTYEEPPEPPSELSGIGVNKYVYYVCNEIGDPWVQLPDATPKEIRVSRKIVTSFTGNLDRPINVYPAFPGTERNYLRAQIARITAATSISPLGFYKFGGGEDAGEGEEELGEEDEENKGEFGENPKYDPVPLKELTDRSMLFWVHHMPYILPQGRTTWWNPNPMPEVADEELGEDEEEDKPRVLGAEPETGPQLLTPCSEDVKVDATPAWSVRCSSTIAEEFGIAVVRSNFWPGAYCFSTQGKLFHNVYLGFGHKFLVPNFSPEPLPFVQQDYPLGPEIMEILDPTGAEEEAWRIAHLPKEKPILELKGEEEEQPEEEEEDDDEDEDDEE